MNGMFTSAHNKEGDKTLRLDVISDKGRWIVNYSEFLGGLKSYILSRDEVTAHPVFASV